MGSTLGWGLSQHSGRVILLSNLDPCCCGLAREETALTHTYTRSRACICTLTPVEPGFLRRAVGLALRGPPPPAVLTNTIWATLTGPPLQFHRGPWSDGQAGGRQVAVVQDFQTPPLTILSAHSRGAWGWGGTLQSVRLCLAGTGGCVCLSLGLCHVGLDVCMFRVGQQRWAWLAYHVPITLPSTMGGSGLRGQVGPSQEDPGVPVGSVAAPPWILPLLVGRGR